MYEYIMQERWFKLLRLWYRAFRVKDEFARNTYLTEMNSDTYKGGYYHNYKNLN